MHTFLISVRGSWAVVNTLQSLNYFKDGSPALYEAIHNNIHKFRMLITESWVESALVSALSVSMKRTDFFPGLLKLFPYFGGCMKQACLDLYDSITPLVEKSEKDFKKFLTCRLM